MILCYQFDEIVEEAEVDHAQEKARRMKWNDSLLVEIWHMEVIKDSDIWVSELLLTDFGSDIKVILISDEYVIPLLGKCSS